MHWRYILFDLDGTLTDSAEGIINSIWYALDAVGKPKPPKEQMRKFLGPPLLESFRNFYEMSSDEEQLAVQKYRERYSTVGMFENRLYEGIDAVLASLKEKGFALALATSKPEEYSIRILEHFGIKGYFDEVVGSTMDGSRSKKADVIREVFRRMGIAEEMKPKVIMVGDRKHDILGAKECGIASLGVYYGFASEHELEQCHADYIVHRVEELSDFFLTVPK